MCHEDIYNNKSECETCKKAKADKERDIQALLAKKRAKEKKDIELAKRIKEVEELQVTRRYARIRRAAVEAHVDFEELCTHVAYEEREVGMGGGYLNEKQAIQAGLDKMERLGKTTHCVTCLGYSCGKTCRYDV